MSRKSFQRTTGFVFSQILGSHSCLVWFLTITAQLTMSNHEQPIAFLPLVDSIRGMWFVRGVQVSEMLKWRKQETIQNRGILYHTLISFTVSFTLCLGIRCGITYLISLLRKNKAQPLPYPEWPASPYSTGPLSSYVELGSFLADASSGPAVLVPGLLNLSMAHWLHFEMCISTQPLLAITFF